MSSRPIIFTNGRMNPPHPGHLKLIQFMIDKAVSVRQNKVFIVLSSSNDFPKNPLDCATKKRLLDEMISSGAISTNGVEVVVICTDDLRALLPQDRTKSPTINGMREALVLGGYRKGGPPLNAVLVIGQDRATDYDTLFPYIPIAGFPPVTVTTDPLPRTSRDVSATEIRELAKSGNEAGFIRAMAPTGLSERTIRGLYGQLNTVLNGNPSGLKKSSKGGSRRRTRRTKVKRTRRTKVKRTRTIKNL